MAQPKSSTPATVQLQNVQRNFIRLNVPPGVYDPIDPEGTGTIVTTDTALIIIPSVGVVEGVRIAPGVVDGQRFLLGISPVSTGTLSLHQLATTGSGPGRISMASEAAPGDVVEILTGGLLAFQFDLVAEVWILIGPPPVEDD